MAERTGKAAGSMSAGEKNLLTTGSVQKKMVRYALPLIVGNLFQQLYNAVDSLIVGNFVGSSALAAVTGTGNLVFLLIGFFNGMAIGEGVVIAHYIGAKDEERTSRSVHTATALGLVISAAMTVVGVLATPVFLVWMGTPDSVMPEAILYLRIYFAGSAGLIMAILGGSILPLLQARIIDMDTVFGWPAVNVSFIVPLCCFLVIVAYGLRTRSIR